MVKCLQLSPTDHNRLLIGYEKGVIVLWDLDKGMPSKNFPASIQDCQQVGGARRRGFPTPYAVVYREGGFLLFLLM